MLMFVANSNIALRPYLVRVESLIASSYYSYYISSILHETKAALLAEKRRKMKKSQSFSNVTEKIRFNLEHGLELYSTEAIELGEGLSALCGSAIIIACPGSTTCPQGLCDCWATADSIRGALEGMELGQLRINISGCPNNCAHSSVADIGLVGLMRKEKALATGFLEMAGMGGVTN